MMEDIPDKFFKFASNLPRIAYYKLDKEVSGFIWQTAKILKEIPPTPRGLNDNAKRVLYEIRRALEEYLKKVDFSMGVKYHDTDEERASDKSRIENETEVLAGELAYIDENDFHHGLDFPDGEFALKLGELLVNANIFNGSFFIPRHAVHDYRHRGIWNPLKKTGVEIDKDLEQLDDDEAQQFIDPPEWMVPPPPPKRPRGSGKIKRRRRKTKKTDYAYLASFLNSLSKTS